MAEIFAAAVRADSPAAVWEAALPLFASAVGARWVAVAAARHGHWAVEAQHGPPRELPLDLIADALDREAPQANPRMTVVLLGERPGPAARVLVFDAGRAERGEAQRLADAQTLARVVSVAVEAAALRERDRRRAQRLESVLEIAALWDGVQETEPLLERIAETSVRLLDAERASIFLWDRASRTLVARPALGVEEGELRIPDDRGVVGQVIQTGEPRRVDAIQNEQRQIDRRVDQQLGYETRTLLCVPLRDGKGRLLGAFEMINKRGGDFTDEDQETLIDLAARVVVALENSQQYGRLLRTRRQMTDQAAEKVRLVGESPAIEALRSTIRRVADTDLAILLLGENGTGKEVAAQLIHYLSRRRDEPFVAVNCAALPETLLESELFGHERGAFTDAHEARAGKFELASGGTLFLDEIGDLSLSGQAKLLRVLEEKLVVRVGGSVSIPIDTRVIAATNQDLAAMVRQRRFREDLFFRLNVVSLEMPPLRERGEDVLLLAEHFLNEFCKRAHRRTPDLSAEARRRLLAHPWPGNVRELRNLMERLAYLAPGEKIDAGELAFILTPSEPALGFTSLDRTLADATNDFQIEYIKRHVKAAQGNMSDAARRLGLHRSNLYRKMRQLGMSPEEAHGN